MSAVIPAVFSRRLRSPARAGLLCDCVSYFLGARFAVAAAIALSNSPACTAVLTVLRTVMTPLRFGASIAFAPLANCRIVSPYLTTTQYLLPCGQNQLRTVLGLLVFSPDSLFFTVREKSGFLPSRSAVASLICSSMRSTSAVRRRHQFDSQYPIQAW